MKNIIKMTLATFAAIAAFAFSSFAGTPAEEQAKACALINEYREEQGLPALKWDDEMSSGTCTRAQEASVVFEHVRPDGSAWYTADENHFYGENLAEGFTSAESVVRAWIASPTHCENILKDYSTMNLQVYVADNGRWYWANEFNY